MLAEKNDRVRQTAGNSAQAGEQGAIILDAAASRRGGYRDSSQIEGRPGVFIQLLQGLHWDDTFKFYDHSASAWAAA